MKELIERNYKSIVNRNLIKRDTQHVDFMHKLNEEVEEVKQEICKNIDIDKLCEELSDVILVCLNWMHHYNQNPEKHIKLKIIKNEQRIKNM